MDKPPRKMAEILPGRILCISKQAVSHLPEIIISVMELVNGKDMEEVISQRPSLSQPVVKYAVKDIVLKQPKKGFFF